MKLTAISILLAAAAIANLRAETPAERELKLLHEQRDKAVAAAVEPIHRKYQAALEQLLRRATQANDLETALKIKQEMGAPVGGGDPASPSSSNDKASGDPRKDPTGWTIVFGAYSWQFLPDNKVIKSKAKESTIDTDYTVTADGRLEVHGDIFEIKSKAKALLWKGPGQKPVEVEVRRTHP